MTNIIAHRGASKDAPENTLAAFSEAWKQSADGIESDYAYTRDHQVVCIHDEDTGRTGDLRLVVARTDWNDLSRVDVGSWKGPEFKDQRVPSLRQVLQQVPHGKWCVLELKTGPEIVAMLEADLHCGQVDLCRLLIIAFDPQTILQAKLRFPTVRAHWLVDYVQTSNGDWTPSIREIAETVRDCRAEGIGSHANRQVLTPGFLKALRAQGVAEFHVWTVDDPADARYFRDQGAWGITTNCPALIRASLNSE